MDYEAVIGLEVHVQLGTNSKIFCSCVNRFGSSPNTQTCPVCLGMPGVLPVLNKKVVNYALKMGMATNCEIPEYSRLARKHYFYPDLPKGYQISQYELPLVEHGWVDVEVGDRIKRIGITRIHIEDDAGKLIHDESRPVSYVDLNRTGTPLIEIVSEPDIRSPEEAAAYIRKIRQLVRYLDISDGNMEEGSLRCDANISLRPWGHKDFGTKSELKNMNSFRNVQKALEYEIMRQTALLLDGREIMQETRLWDAGRGVTHSMRGKEEAHDYRYFPDPDLVPVKIDDPWKDEIRATLPELPDEKCKRFMSQYGLPEYDARVLTVSRQTADFFEECAGLFENAKTISNWIMVELMKLEKQTGTVIHECHVTPARLTELLKFIESGAISAQMGKDVLAECFESGKAPSVIIEEKGLSQVSDESELEAVVAGVINANPEEVELYRNGRKKVLSFLMGQVMKETRGKANPKKVNEIFRRILGT